MRNLKIIVVVLFLVVSIAFTALFCYNFVVADRTAPVIYCDGEPLEVSVSASDRDLCAGLQATDDRDGDITDRIIVQKVSRLISNNTAVVSYAVFDSSSNVCTFSRDVTYTDYRSPRFTLDQPLIYSLNSLITIEDRLKASDVIDGDISSRIRLSSSNVYNDSPGQYPILIQVTNSTGDTSAVRLTVTIKNYTARDPVIRLDHYLIYIDSDTELDTESLREHILSVRESADGAAVDPSLVEISGEIDYTRPGSNDITFSYVNSDGLDYSVILTVVRE